MNNTDHSNCLHTKDSKGRAACRKAGGPIGHFRKVQADMINSGEALCHSCFWNASQSALENYADYMKEQGTPIQDFDDRDLAIAYTWARSYLFDDACLSACQAHEHLL